jgi:hypothetical protein
MMNVGHLHRGKVIRLSPVMEDAMMAKRLISDALWERIEPLFPKLPPHPKGGRPWVGNREALTGRGWHSQDECWTGWLGWHVPESSKGVLGDVSAQC